MHPLQPQRQVLFPPQDAQVPWHQEKCSTLDAPTGNPVPIARQGTLGYLTPTVIPYAVADAARLGSEQRSGMELVLWS